jgi:hypothetical protein
MRKLFALVLSFVLLSSMSGCGGDDSAVKGYIQDVADFINLYKTIKVADSPRKPPPNPASVKARITAHIEALKRIKDLPAEERLTLQLKYGPSVEGIVAAFDSELSRVETLALSKPQGGPPAGGAGPGPGAMPPPDAQQPKMGIGFDGLEGCEELLFTPDALVIIEGYPDMTKIAVNSVNDLAGACGKLKSNQEAQEALVHIRQLRYRLTLDAVKLQHLEPRLTIRSKTAAPYKARADLLATAKASAGANLATCIGNLRQIEERVRALGNDGAAVVDAIEPLPDYYQTLIKK